MNMHNAPALQASLRDAVREYETKRASFDDIEAAYKELHANLDMSVTVGGTYVGRVYNYHPSISRHQMEENLLESAWRHAYNGYNIGTIASASDRSRFELALKNPPEFTIGNITATFGDYLKNQRFHILKGLAECFTDLDPAYKSHSKVKVGVSGLPKRIILSRVVGDYGVPGYGADRMKDTINALNTMQGDPHIEHKEFRDLIELAVADGKSEYKGLTLKIFGNGNGHLMFSKHKLVQINDALAEFYGDILPDAPDENAKKRPGTDVAKDLQFYPTPNKVIERIFSRDFEPRDGGEGRKFLEPSCGDGRIMDMIRTKLPKIRMVGVEVNAARAQMAISKGHKVLIDNFLQVRPNPIYDDILMNPPFYGLHWRKHLDHAIKFLRPPKSDKRWDRGSLICILPASAHYDGHLDDLKGEWRDLPVASFAESGTNVPTGYFMTSGDKK